MRYQVLETLYDWYPETIQQMTEQFSSHEFIQKLAQRHQREYIEALYFFRNRTHRGEYVPFRLVHNALAKKIKAFPNL